MTRSCDRPRGACGLVQRYLHRPDLVPRPAGLERAEVGAKDDHEVGDVGVVGVTERLAGGRDRDDDRLAARRILEPQQLSAQLVEQRGGFRPGGDAAERFAASKVEADRATAIVLERDRARCARGKRPRKRRSSEPAGVDAGLRA